MRTLEKIRKLTKNSGSIALRDEIYSLLELVYQEFENDFFYVHVCPRLTIILSDPLLMTISENILRNTNRNEGSLYLSVPQNLGSFYVTFLSLNHKNYFQLPLSIMIHESCDDIGIILRETMPKLPNLSLPLITCESCIQHCAKHYPNLKLIILHDTIYDSMRMQLNNIMGDEGVLSSLHNVISDLKNCSTLLELENLWTGVKHDFEQYFDIELVYNNMIRSSKYVEEKPDEWFLQQLSIITDTFNEKMPIDGIVLSLKYLINNTINKAKECMPDLVVKSTLNMQLVPTKEIIDFVHNSQGKVIYSDSESDQSSNFGDETGLDNEEPLYITIIEDAIVSMIKRNKLSQKLHLISLYNQDVENICKTICCMETGKDLLCVLHTGNGTHWILGIISVSRESIIIFDSLKSNCARNTEFTILWKYAYVYALKHGKDMNDNWQFIYANDCPQQKNSNDCGLFVIYFAKALIENNLKTFETPLSSLGGRKWIKTILREHDRPIMQDIMECAASIIEFNVHFLNMAVMPDLTKKIKTQPTEGKFKFDF
jgi:Ulp1 protease family, C-terminal catalytic domain